MVALTEQPESSKAIMSRAGSAPDIYAENYFPWDGQTTVQMRGELPRESGIYFVTRGDQLLYVGLAQNIRKRWRSHHRLEDLLPTDVIGWSLLHVYMLRRGESLAIQIFKPSLNGRIQRHEFRTARPIENRPRIDPVRRPSMSLETATRLIFSTNFVEDFLNATVLV